MAVTAEDLALREDICYQIFGDVGPLIRGEASLGSEAVYVARGHRGMPREVSKWHFAVPVTTTHVDMSWVRTSNMSPVGGIGASQSLFGSSHTGERLRGAWCKAVVQGSGLA